MPRCRASQEAHKTGMPSLWTSFRTMQTTLFAAPSWPGRVRSSYQFSSCGVTRQFVIGKFAARHPAAIQGFYSFTAPVIDDT